MVAIHCAMCGKQKLFFPAHIKRVRTHLCSKACRIAWLKTGILKVPLEERFWKYVLKSNGCWEWQGLRTVGGYGLYWIERNQQTTAHRVSWLIAYGPIPDGIEVLHSCDNPPCIRPQHLFLGTQQDNIDDMIRKGRAHWQ